jgi:hypothetical protein
VTGGGVLSVAVSGLADGTTYHWQARALDGWGAAGPWTAFGGNPESAADFTVDLNRAPFVPAGVGQYRSDGTTAIAVGATTPESTVVLLATMSDPNGADLVRLEVELRTLGTPFSNAATHQGGFVPNGGVGGVGVFGLADGTSYHWQARVVDSEGLANPWVAFGGNAESVADFTVTIMFELTVGIGGSAGGTVTGPGITCEPSCSAWALPNSSLSLTATAASGAVFKQWGGACSGTAPTCAVTMNAGKAMTATFSKVFADATLAAGSTVLKVVHFTDLRAAIDTLRSRHGLGSFAWTDPTLTAGTTPVKRQHLTDLRAALNQAYQWAGRPHPAYTDPTPTAGVTIVNAVHVNELRNAVRALE